MTTTRSSSTPRCHSRAFGPLHAAAWARATDSTEALHVQFPDAVPHGIGFRESSPCSPFLPGWWRLFETRLRPRIGQVSYYDRALLRLVNIGCWGLLRGLDLTFGPRPQLSTSARA